MRHSPASNFALVTVGFNCSNCRQRERSLQQQVQVLAQLFKQILPNSGHFHSTLLTEGRNASLDADVASILWRSRHQPAGEEIQLGKRGHRQELVPADNGKGEMRAPCEKAAALRSPDPQVAPCPRHGVVPVHGSGCWPTKQPGVVAGCLCYGSGDAQQTMLLGQHFLWELMSPSQGTSKYLHLKGGGCCEVLGSRCTTDLL